MYTHVCMAVFSSVDKTDNRSMEQKVYVCILFWMAESSDASSRTIKQESPVTAYTFSTCICHNCSRTASDKTSAACNTKCTRASTIAS